MAFTQLHGLAPPLASGKGVTLKPFSRPIFKLVLIEGIVIERCSNNRTNIIGTIEVGCAISVDMDKDTIHKTNEFFWNTSELYIIYKNDGA